MLVLCIAFVLPQAGGRGDNSQLQSAQATTPKAGSEHSNGSANQMSERVGVLNLPDGTMFTTTLYDLKVIGQLRTRQKVPYYILSGRSCVECDENISIYIHSPSDGPMKNEAEQQRFTYPGSETDEQQNGKVVYKGRMFFGGCFAEHPNAAVWFEGWVGEDGKWHNGVFTEEVKDDRLVRKKPRGLQLRQAENAVRSGRCHELPGTSRYSEP